MAETGLNPNVNRDYDSAVGRYVESDPIGLDGGINTYAYVGDSPVLDFDNMGLAGARSGGRGTRRLVSRQNVDHQTRAHKWPARSSSSPSLRFPTLGGTQ
jgi:uncharacterized protein RhaS with RHS repeats